MFKPRPMQAEILQYTGGKMGISAVPGSGKTHTLSYLAAKIIADGRVNSDQEVLIVTLVNSAVNNFSRRVDDFIQNEFHLLPHVNYRVRTLHGLSRDIVSGRTDLAGLSNRFGIVDERDRELILDAIVSAYLHTHPEFVEFYTDASNGETPVAASSPFWKQLLVSVANSIIRTAKDLQMTPANVREQMDSTNVDLPLLNFGMEVYINYQRALNFRGAVDFDDLIRLALQVLTLDHDYLARLRHRWNYVLEDEAQDSSHLQEEILRTLVGENGNWVRVGDPNQAIYETFTTANPKYLIDFRKEPGVISRDLPNSGRSTQSIIHLANLLIQWTTSEHPEPELQKSLTEPYTLPTPPGDPQPNPPDQPETIGLISTKYTPDGEIRAVISSLRRWLPSHPEETVAILVPTNDRGEKYVDALKQAEIPYFEVLKNSQPTRRVAHLLTEILQYLAEPSNPKKLSKLIANLPLPETNKPAEKSYWEDVQKLAADLVLKCAEVEDYLFPLPGEDWLIQQAGESTDHQIIDYLQDLRPNLQKWTTAILLPVDQLILTISVDLFTSPIDLALAHSIAILLEHKARNNPTWRLPEFALELSNIARDKAGISGFSAADTGFNPDDYRGQVIVTTIHKAKGLEWDRVHLTSVSNYDFPAAQPYDEYIGEKWFIRNRLNLQAESVALTKALLTRDISGLFMEEGQATMDARFEYSSERLRLLFVGITRARKELVITWNTGKSPRQEAREALALTALRSLWNAENQ